MRKLLDEHGYEDAVIFGHALAGNLHFQMGDDFAAPGTAEKFDVFSKALSELVSVRYEGSLKAEHGTGRAIAPFVEREWGSAAYRIMQKIKPLFDPEGLLNPGVLITDNKTVHLEHFKEMRLTNPLVDLCIECGFCEPACPSAQLTMSPRQRIVVTREMQRLRETGERSGSTRRDARRFRLCRARDLCRRQCVCRPLPGRHRDRHDGDRRTRPAPDRRRAQVRAWRRRSSERDRTWAQIRRRRLQALGRGIIGNGVTDTLADVSRALLHTPRVSRALRPGLARRKLRATPAAHDPKTAGFPGANRRAVQSRRLFSRLPDAHVRRQPDVV